MTTGQRIRAARKDAGLTQKQLAQRIGCPPSRISEWERDCYPPKGKALKNLAEILGVPSDKLISEKQAPVKQMAMYNDVLSGYRCLGYCIVEENRVSYIQALRKLEQHPDNWDALNEALKCEEFFLNDFPGFIEADIDGQAAIDAMRRFAKSGKRIHKRKFEPAQRKKYDKGDLFEFWR